MRAGAAQTNDPTRIHTTQYCHITPKHYATLDDALLGIARRRQSIRHTAEEIRRCGGVYRDQDHPVEIISLSPEAPARPPLLLIGGMGPLAGLTGFEMACRRFRGQRRILLFQACGTPCRTTAITAQHALLSKRTETQVIISIAHALIKGATMIEEPMGEAILLCNTAHYFLPAASNRFLATPIAEEKHVTIHSLISAAADETQRLGHRRALILATKGTYAAELYTEALYRRDITPVTPAQQAQAWLEIAIRYGIKGQNIELARQAGCACFHAFEEDLRKIDCIIAGCTEIPLLLKLVIAHTGYDRVAGFLRETDIVDPLASLLKGLQ
ncbi:MAG: aspartate/glutamate racemase family protein [Candidatus Thiodiazotropha sp. (ex Epidulcina cf. delphinae)]|nr:aspartate/glutamate racemase family protein [Candidatus Thiodiazotropha sp. (ex Epidulcina cf. delphinae)]